MDEALAGFASRLTTRERSRPGALSPQSLAEAWEQFRRDWEQAVVYENFLLDLTEQINARCPDLHFVDTLARQGTVVSDRSGNSVILSMVNWNGWWQSPLTDGSGMVYPPSPICDRNLTFADFAAALPKHLDSIADKFVEGITSRRWTTFARLEIPEGCAATSRWRTPLRLIRHYVVDHDVFVARFDMIGGTALA